MTPFLFFFFSSIRSPQPSTTTSNHHQYPPLSFLPLFFSLFLLLCLQPKSPTATFPLTSHRRPTSFTDNLTHLSRLLATTSFSLFPSLPQPPLPSLFPASLPFSLSTSPSFSLIIDHPSLPSSPPANPTLALANIGHHCCCTHTHTHTLSLSLSLCLPSSFHPKSIFLSLSLSLHFIFFFSLFCLLFCLSLKPSGFSAQQPFSRPPSNYSLIFGDHGCCRHLSIPMFVLGVDNCGGWSCYGRHLTRGKGKRGEQPSCGG